MKRAIIAYVKPDAPGWDWHAVGAACDLLIGGFGLLSDQTVRQAIRAANPGCKLIMYACVPSVSDTLVDACPVSQAAAAQWLLRDANNQPIPLRDSQSVLVDVGREEYAVAWAREAAGRALACNARGVLMDDISANYEWLSDVPCPQYPNIATWRQAMTCFLFNAPHLLTAAGLYVLANYGTRGSGAPWASWDQCLNGAQEEGHPLGAITLGREAYYTWQDDWQSWHPLPIKA